jgi:hypothetical protein
MAHAEARCGVLDCALAGGVGRDMPKIVDERGNNPA